MRVHSILWVIGSFLIPTVVMGAGAFMAEWGMAYISHWSWVVMLIVTAPLIAWLSSRCLIQAKEHYEGENR